MTTVLPRLTSIRGFRVLACEQHGKPGIGCRPGQVVLVDLVDEYVVADIYPIAGKPDPEWDQGDYLPKQDLVVDFHRANEAFRDRCIRRRCLRTTYADISAKLRTRFGVTLDQLRVSEDDIQRSLDSFQRSSDILQRIVEEHGLSTTTGHGVSRGGHVSLS